MRREQRVRGGETGELLGVCWQRMGLDFQGHGRRRGSNSLLADGAWSSSQRTAVVLPTWRMPVSTSTRGSPRARWKAGKIVRGMVCIAAFYRKALHLSITILQIM